MNCMKCGKEIPDGQVFCPECLEDMAKYPVAHDAHVQILRRPARSVEKKVKEISPQEQIRQLQRVIRWLVATAGMLFLIICILALLLLHHTNAEETRTPTGRNYTTSPKTVN